MKRRIFKTVVFAALAAAAGRAQAQQAYTPQRISQPAYAAVNTPGAAPNASYATQYAVTADGYLVEQGYGGNQSGYYVQGGEPAADGSLDIQQTALNYDPEAQQAAPEGDGSCNSGCCTPCCTNCCDPFWAHRTGVYAEWLYLKMRNNDVANALPQNGIGPGAVPFGAVGSNSPTYQPSGFRIGATYALNRCSSINAAYTYYHAESNGSTFANPPLVVHSLLTLPQTGTAASDGTAAITRYDVRFQFADLDYRRLIRGGTNHYINYVVGARYANLYQLYRQAQINGPTQTGVGTNIGMDAAGARVGLMGARKAPCSGFYLYGNAFANILVGNFRSSYLQTNNLAGVQGFNTWQNFRPVPILEYELGTGWRSANGLWQISGGYYFAAWFNVVSTGNYVNAVQTNNFTNVANNITFDGLVVRAQRVW